MPDIIELGDVDSSDSDDLRGLGTKVEEAADLEALSP